jgi:hypothetical protein
MYGMLGFGDATPPLVSDSPDVFSASDIQTLELGPGYSCAGPGLTNCGPDSSQVAPLQVGALAQQTSSSGQYSLNPSTGQLQQNVVPGISNTTLLWIGGGIFGAVLLAGAMGGRRR